ncbi:MAG TPA: acyl-CoA-binding protein [Salinimicrobium sp.]|nr:acyl-CoA-binding protein [Salinimicrobium sp.]
MTAQKEKLDAAFEKAYERASNTSKRFPPDIMLLFYAYYKQATEQGGIYNLSDETDVRSAFKLNALLQVKGLSVVQAKKKYIELVERYID